MSEFVQTHELEKELELLKTLWGDCKAVEKALGHHDEDYARKLLHVIYESLAHLEKVNHKRHEEAEAEKHEAHNKADFLRHHYEVLQHVNEHFHHLRLHIQHILDHNQLEELRHRILRMQEVIEGERYQLEQAAHHHCYHGPGSNPYAPILEEK